MSGEKHVYQVAELTRLIKGRLEQAFGDVWLEGEISNLRRPSSGHLYFTLKDENAQIRAVLFRGSQRGMKVPPSDGMKVRVLGGVTVYERSGDYQILVRVLEETGRGSLQQRFEELKKKLAAEGLFEKERKRPLPALPQHIGVVTSPTGAAVRDILNVLLRRFPNVHVLIAPVRVQGQGAAEEIAAAIEALNRRADLDVLIVGRGGGSLEDLWCFNEEVVARSIAGSRLPVISAVGHEIDFTIADFVADLRAPTPSAAAELVVEGKEALLRRVDVLGDRLASVTENRLTRLRSRLETAAGSYVFQEPGNAAKRYRERISRLEMQVRHQLVGRLSAARQHLDDVNLRLDHGLKIVRERRRQDVRRLESQLRMLNPLAVLDRGFSLTRDAAGKIIRRVEEVGAGDRVLTRVAGGEFESEVKAVRRQEHGGQQ